MRKEEILQKVNYDIDKAKAIFEWLNEGNKTSASNQDAIIEVHEKGVRVQALGEDFVISLHDLDNGKNNFRYEDAMSRLDELDMATFNRKQAAIICIYLDQINDKLIEAGGDQFAEEWYITNELYIPKEERSSADYNVGYTWFFNSSLGCIDCSDWDLEAFRCRPIINLEKQKGGEN